MKETSNFNSRRQLIRKGMISVLAGASAISLLNSCNKGGGEEVTPPEDLMREHGIIRRIMIIYETCRSRILNNEQVDPAVLMNSAQIIRKFIEEYHEKLEENYLFPAFDSSNKLTDLVRTLKAQHKAGRTITDQILKFAESARGPQSDQKTNLVSLLDNFNIMYRAHAAREDTVLFPAIRQIMSGKEFRDLGEVFEDQEKSSFGNNGFENTVIKVADIEKCLGIYELEKYNRQ